MLVACCMLRPCDCGRTARLIVGNSAGVAACVKAAYIPGLAAGDFTCKYSLLGFLSAFVALVANTNNTQADSSPLSSNSRRLRATHLFLPRDRAQHHSSIHPGPSRLGTRQDQIHPQGLLKRYTTNPAEQVGHGAGDAKVCPPGRANTQERFGYYFICMSFRFAYIP